VEEALRLKADLGDEAAWLGGGTSLLAEDLLPEHVVALSALGLDTVEATPAALRLGATCTLGRLLEDPATPLCIRQAIRHVNNRNVRNQATIGGHVAAGRSCGNVLPVLVALDAVLEVAGREEAGEVPLTAWLAGDREGLVTAVRVPRSDPPRAVAVGRYARTANAVSVATAAVVLGREGECLSRPAVAVGGVGPHVVRLRALEVALDGLLLPGIEVLEARAAPALRPVDDLRGSAAWKRRVAATLVARTVHAAWREEGGRF
jgi:putative selenate reductase FAD-binding subunit